MARILKKARTTKTLILTARSLLRILAAMIGGPYARMSTRPDGTVRVQAGRVSTVSGAASSLSISAGTKLALTAMSASRSIAARVRPAGTTDLQALCALEIAAASAPWSRP